MDATDHCAVLILAAGLNSRMGGFPKALLPINGTTFLLHIQKQFVLSGFTRCYAVLGFKAQDIQNETRTDSSLSWIINSDYENGQFSSLQAGIRFLNKHASVSCVLVHLTDIPFFDPKTPQVLLGESQKHPDLTIIPEHHGKGGHPILIPRSQWDRILSEDPSANTKDVLHAFSTRIPVQDPGILKDFDFHEDFIRMSRTGILQLYNE